jgi:NADH dehydrogenase [ubiquinone] 1 alpha subcomplex assembly factor 1
VRLWVAALLAAELLAGCSSATPERAAEPNTMTTQESMLTLFDFSAPEPDRPWRVVNDTVMGGVSESGFERTAGGTAVFAGNVSLENFGGFASVRSGFGNHDLSGHEGLAVRLRGDGKKYKLYLKTNQRDNGYGYQADFETRSDEWMTVRVPFRRFRPHYRGMNMFLLPSVKPRRIRAVGFLIADKQAGPFRLEVQWIKAYGAG